MLADLVSQVLETSQSSVRRDKWEMLVLLVLLLLCHGLGNTHGSQDDHAGDGDMLSLLDFKRAITSDPVADARWETRGAETIEMLICVKI